MVVKRIGVWSAARIAGILYAALGLILGVIFALISLVGGGIASASHATDAPPAWLALVFGVGAIVFLPIFYGVMGLIMAAISAGLYNLFARRVGGVEIDLE